MDMRRSCLVPTIPQRKDISHMSKERDRKGEGLLNAGFHSMANKCYLKVAQIAADLGMYEEAIEKFEKVASAAVDDALLKWSLKEYFLKAGLCHICTGVCMQEKREHNVE